MISFSDLSSRDVNTTVYLAAKRANALGDPSRASRADHNILAELQVVAGRNPVTALERHRSESMAAGLARQVSGAWSSR